MTWQPRGVSRRARFTGATPTCTAHWSNAPERRVSPIALALTGRESVDDTAETIGRVNEQHELIERVSSTVCERYVADIKLPEGTEAILLRVYFDGDAAYQLAPPANAGRWPWTLLEEEVAEPAVDDVPGIEEVLELAAEDDAVLQTYFDALTRRLQAALGVRALHADLD